MPPARLGVAVGLLAVVALRPTPAQKPDAPADFAAVRPVVVKYCVSCHDAKGKKGGLDLDRFATAADLRKATKVWEGVVEQLEAGEMPPKDKPQPTDAERKQLVAWVRSFLDAEARSRSGDPGHVPLRRLSNAEYDYTVRDLTGVDLRPAREFPADGAAGEGFTNAAEALSDISPALFTKYLNAAKDIAEHAVLLPDGVRFSMSKTRRDWTDEGTAKLREFYAQHAPPDGKIPLAPYLTALVRHRAALAAGETTAVAAKEKLNAKYLASLWVALNFPPVDQPLAAVHEKLKTATEKDIPAIAADIAAQQAALWKTVRVGNYVQENWTGSAGTGYRESLARQVPVDPPAAASTTLRVAIKPTPGQADVTLALAGRVLAGDGGRVVWQRPRFEGPGKPTLLLKDYPDFGKAFEADYSSAFANAAAYLAAAVELANDEKLSPDGVAKSRGLNAVFLRRWAEVLAVEPYTATSKTTAAVALDLLSEKKPVDPAWPQITGWRKAGTDLPVVVANSSDAAVQIPGRVAARGVSVHPMPKEFVAAAWTSPVSASVSVSVKVAHAHPACGNGVAWWLEHRRAGRATSLGAGTVDLGKEIKPPATTVDVEKGDVLVLAVDARDANHVCDMTEIEFAVASKEKTWDLGKTVSANVTAGNPHSDVWSFARGASKGTPGARFPAGSVLAEWRAEAANPRHRIMTDKLAGGVQRLLCGPRPADPKHPDRAVYDRLVSVDGPLFVGVDVAAITKPRTGTFGLPASRFTDANLFSDAAAVTEVTLPAALFAGREFVVDAKLDGPADRVVQVRAGEAWHPTLLAPPGGEGYKKIVEGNAAFRRLFPLYLCFPQVVPTDEVVTLKMFHREDEPLVRLFLDDAAAARLDTLWTEQRFVSRQPVAEFDYLPQFMGFTTQDTPKAFQQFFVERKPRFQKLAAEFVRDEEAATPKHLDALLALAERAYRRPLKEGEKSELRALYQTVRGKGAGHDEAFRGVLARVLVSPAFLFRIEAAPKGKEPAAVGDFELATRLSYFLWSSTPDAELTARAAAGKLRDPAVLAQQTARMLKDDRTRALAVEFGTQWIHVRGFDEFKEKNETLFPPFDAPLRAAMYEESILFFQDLFRGDRTVTTVLDADHTFLNEALAKHYGIPGVTGPAFRKVDGVRKYGRGGVLGLASVQAKQAGASRTSPVLRGNWVVETLLGEKLPRPPANVPQLPEVEGADKLTMRQLVERHAKDQACAVCHVRIDPFGFALEKYDPIGRLRDKDFGGLPIDASSKLKDGTAFEGIDGLRTYLLTKKKDVVVRLFCKRLLGYALGRSVTLSDTTLLDEMVSELNKNEGRVSAAVRAIVRSPQFRMVRGAGNSEEEFRHR